MLDKKSVLLGADGVTKYLEKISEGMSGGEVDIGFMGADAYSDGTPVAAVAFWNEFGGTSEMPAHDVTVNRSLNASGDFNQGGRFVKASKANFSTTHHVEAYEVNRPPRPFFRSMIADKSGDWPKDIAELAKKEKYNGKKVLESIGQEIKGQLEESINNLMTPELAKSTIRAKKFAKPLIRTGEMLNAITFEVRD